METDPAHFHMKTTPRETGACDPAKPIQEAFIRMNPIVKFVGLPAAAAVGGTLFLVAPGRYTKAMAAPFADRNYAHRGLHKKDKSVPENSLGAFQAAVDAGYGIELDVHLTADDQLVVYHDDKLKRVCGVEGRTDDKTLAELQALHLHGTEYTIPTLDAVLDVLAGKVPLILEIKRGEKRSRNMLLCKKIRDRLLRYDGPVCIESFDPAIVAWWRRNAPEVLRGQLSQPPKMYLKNSTWMTGFLCGNLLTNVIARPHFIAYCIGKKPFTVQLCERMGALRACWTSRAWKHEKGNDMVIFEHYRPNVWFQPKA